MMNELNNEWTMDHRFSLLNLNEIWPALDWTGWIIRKRYLYETKLKRKEIFKTESKNEEGNSEQ